MNVLSLFSGIGGLDLGLQRAGMTIAGQVEIDPWCRKVLAKHWPEVPRHDDVRTCVQWWGGRDAPDLVAGGFPCQPTSVAGQRKAQADSRWLWPAFAGVLRQLRPSYVLVENPPGLLAPVAVKDDQDRVIGYTAAPVEDVLGDLARLGYDAEWDCIPAAFFGAPHIRNRVFIVAYPAGAGSPDGRAAPCGRPGTPRRVESERLGSHVADADDDQPDEPQGEVRAIHERSPSRRRALGAGRPGPAHANADREPLGWPSVPRCERGHWAVEPGVGRVAHGIPARVDRLRGLGNAVVPQVAEHIGHLIMQAAS